MRSFCKIIILIIIGISIFGCKSNQVVPPPAEDIVIIEKNNESSNDNIIDIAEKDIEGTIPTTQEIDEEFKRSTSELKDETITQDTFLADKKEILKIIDELAKIMIAQNYGKWLYYLSPQSIKYWQNQSNLIDVSARLPVKGYTLKNLDDYFKMIFIPSRRNSKVDEIRYISPTFVKAVQVRGEQDIVYYFFVKINNAWLLELDTL